MIFLRNCARKFLPKSAKKFVLALVFRLGHLCTLLLVLATRAFSKNLTLSYLPTYKQDGTGAQIQRQFAIFGLSKLIKSGYLFTEFQEVSVHPLDPFQTKETYGVFLEKLNHVFRISNSEEEIFFDSTMNFKNPSALEILTVAFSSFFKKQKMCIKIGEPYKLTEYFPECLSEIVDNLPNWKRRESIDSQTLIAIHYRQGVGGMVTYPGQKIPRELGLSYFRDLIHRFQPHFAGSTRIVILTDAPSHQTTYRPPQNQAYLWEGTPGFSDGLLTIQPLNFDEFTSYCTELNVISGGDPIDAIQDMANANFFFMGQSSLSYVGAILNNVGVVIYPKNFWHRPLTSWKIG